MQTQIDPRYNKRVPCQFRIDDVRYQGLVLNLSRGGLFVTSRAMPRVGDPLALYLDAGKPSDGLIPLEARVVWCKRSHHSMIQMRKGGLGLEIAQPPRAYRQFLANVAGLEDMDSPVRREDPVIDDQEYRVRLSLPGTPRTRTLVIAASDQEVARLRAIDKCGEDWTILDIRV